MDVLAVTPEIFPLIKTGGLADVTGALPLALAAKGVNTRTLIPGYTSVMARITPSEPVLEYALLQGGAATVRTAASGGLDLFVLDAPHLFDRPGGPYGDTTGADWPDNWRRFAALSQVGGDIAGGAVSSYRPDVVHAHDWQAALTLAYMRYGRAPETPSVMTVHNLAFQGPFGAGIFGSLGLPGEAMSLEGVEYYGGVGYLKAGLQAAWAITTVSPTYAQEIRTPEFGMGLDGLLNTRAADLHGIVNGIDTGIWDPAADPLLAGVYSAKTLKARGANKRAVEERFGLVGGEGPILCVVSRLTWQKGIDVIVAALDEMVGAGVRIAVLGAGDAALEGALLGAAARHRGRVGVVIGYDEGLSHMMQGGCDAILVPSRFEPCGLTQLYGLRYGCVPILARTGGLADTIVDANEAALAAGVATGFLFSPVSTDALMQAVHRALAAYSAPTVWSGIQKQGMKSDVSWSRSADRYIDLYKSLLARKVG